MEPALQAVANQDGASAPVKSLPQVARNGLAVVADAAQELWPMMQAVQIVRKDRVSRTQNQTNKL
jgi:hypothetical protein